MNDELGILAHKLLIAIITLGIFCIVSIAYSLFVWFATPADAARESRVRCIMLAGVTLMSGAILVVGLEQLFLVVGLFGSADVKVSDALVRVAHLHSALDSWEQWCIVGVLTAVTLLPLAARDDAYRLRLNKAVAGLNFTLALASLMLTTAIYAAWRGLGLMIGGQ